MNKVEEDFKRIEQAMSIAKRNENNNGWQDWQNGPRNFSEHTQNRESKDLYRETQHTNKGMEFNNIGEYKNEMNKLGANDPIVKTQVSRADDVAFREMTQIHKTEGKDLSEKDLGKLQAQQKFENSYCQYNLDKESRNMSRTEDFVKKNEVVKSYNEYKGIDPIKNEQKPAVEQKSPVAQAQSEPKKASPEAEAFAAKFQSSFKPKSTSQAISNMADIREKFNPIQRSGSSTGEQQKDSQEQPGKPQASPQAEAFAKSLYSDLNRHQSHSKNIDNKKGISMSIGQK